MKILLLGNYSGLGSTLKEGLEQLGEKPILAANGDGWKNIPGADMPIFNTKYHNRFDRFLQSGIKPRFDRRFEEYDVVQVPGPDVFIWYTGKTPFKHLFERNHKVFINAAGNDYYLYEAWKNKSFEYDYYLYDDNDEACEWSDGKTLASKMMNRRCEYVMKNAYGIIPVIPYEYELPYKQFPNLRKPILLPVNLDKIKYRPNKLNNKLVIFHGINRVKDKGSNYINEAMDLIQKRYPDQVECIVADRMPYNDYLKTIERANVIVDQCKGFGYGLNACIAMAKGKVVLSGAEQRVIENIDKQCPIFNIRPISEQIYNVLKHLMDHSNEIEEMGYQSRKYVERNHNYIDVAEQYINEWKK